MGKNIENMLSNKKTSMQFLREREEAERRQLQKMFMGEGGGSGGPDGDASQPGQGQKRKGAAGDEDDAAGGSGGGPAQPKILRITRTFRNQDGKEFTRTEIVRKPLVIETYTKVRETKDEAFIRQFATLDDTAKEEMKKERRRLQEQLRRIKRNQDKISGTPLASTSSGQGTPRTPKRSSRPNKNKPDLKLRCGACGGVGHMRTNKACPKFVPSEFEAMMER